MNDDLIRQAALASVKKGAKSDAEAVRNYREAVRHAEIAFAVFEEAHAPTDDERKAIAQIILPAFDQLASAVYNEGPYSEAEAALDAADFLIAAGFRRPVSPERVDDLIDTRAGLALANAAWQEGASTMLRSVDEHDGGKPWSKPVSPYSAPLLARIKADAGMPEPEGAPTIRDHVRALTGVTDEVLDELGGFQGEPTDTQSPRCGGGRTNCRNDQWPPMHTMACPVSKARAAAETTKREETR